jgi:hypothetical protein
MLILDEAAVLQSLDLEGCRTAVRRAMIALSASETRQLPRSIIPPTAISGPSWSACSPILPVLGAAATWA